MSTTVIPATGGEPEDDFDSRGQYLADQEREQEIDVLAGLRELEGADGARWRIYRIGSDDPSLNGFLDEIGTVQLSAVWIRDKFGGGKYRVRGHLAGNGRIIAHRTIEIAGDAPRRASSIATAPVASGNSSSVSFEEWERKEEIRAEKRRKERMDLIGILGPIAAPIIAAWVGRQGPDMATLIAALKPPPPPDPIALLTQLKALNASESAHSNPFDTAFKVLEKLQDLSPPEGGTGWMDVLKEVVKTAGPSLGGVIESAMQKSATTVSPALPPSVAPAAAGGNIALTAGTFSEARSGDPTMLGMLALLPWLKEQMAMALQKAAQGSDPGLIAERILDDLPQGMKPDALVEFIARADWFQQLQRFDSRVAAYGPWFNAMRTAMLDEITGGEPSGTAKPQGDSTTQLPPMSVTPMDDEIEKPIAPPKLGL